jgi:hypothetical protein
MTPVVAVVVARGVVDIPDPAAVGEQRRLAALNPGFSARTFAHVRRYRVGETITLPAGETARLVELGVVTLVP